MELSSVSIVGNSLDSKREGKSHVGSGNSWNSGSPEDEKRLERSSEAKPSRAWWTWLRTLVCALREKRKISRGFLIKKIMWAYMSSEKTTQALVRGIDLRRARKTTEVDTEPSTEGRWWLEPEWKPCRVSMSGWTLVTSARLRSWTDREGFSLEEVDAEAFIHWDRESWENAKVGGGLSLGLV